MTKEELLEYYRDGNTIHLWCEDTHKQIEGFVIGVESIYGQYDENHYRQTGFIVSLRQPYETVKVRIKTV